MQIIINPAPDGSSGAGFIYLIFNTAATAPFFFKNLLRNGVCNGEQRIN